MLFTMAFKPDLLFIFEYYCEPLFLLKVANGDTLVKTFKASYKIAFHV